MSLLTPATIVPVAGRRVLVTGGSRGIGRAVVQAFAEAGDRVAIHHRDSATLAEKLRAGLPGGPHCVVRADIADPAAVQSMVDTAVAELGGLDVLVNNAGVFTPHPILDTPYEQWQREWQRTLAVNLLGAANTIWCAVRHMGPGGADREHLLAGHLPG